ncbi:MAG: MaoC/PaaZ C-terminal domain-containing protein [Tissierellales bacterium]
MNLQKIKDLDLKPLVQSYDVRDTILYALGLGYGEDPLDESELPFVFEDKLKFVPSMSSLLCHPGFWLQEPQFEVNWVKILHAEQDFVIHKPFPATGTVRGTFSVRGIEDKGAEKGALLHQEKALYNEENGDHLATVRSTLFLRGNGGEGGYGEPIEPAAPLPDTAPDAVVELPTDLRAALIYRLSGDWNPLHASPEIAKKAGFEKPILHGLCTNGMACRAILKQYCDNDPERFKSMFVRFSRPVYPGETIRFEFYDNGNEIRFRALVKERNVVVLDRCRAEISR